MTAGTDGKYALTLAEGENTITVEAKNGGTASTLTVKVILDTTAPAIELSAKEETVESAEYTFTVNAADAETVVVKVNGTTVTAGENGYTVTLEEGENEISVTATDAAGNIGTAKVTVTLAAENTEGGGSGASGGCGGSVAAVSAVGALGLLVCAVFVLRRKAR